MSQILHLVETQFGGKLLPICLLIYKTVNKRSILMVCWEAQIRYFKLLFSPSLYESKLGPELTFKELKPVTDKVVPINNSQKASGHKDLYRTTKQECWGSLEGATDLTLLGLNFFRCRPTECHQIAF